ncbi:hypothetical protein E2C01_012981 [Portunus trituberculatus]|uniref:Uncharacterized protein n=1 Tax=Portunus trituberculatus TaxID=210409 RepID=A0A5B7DFA2_PORTR|nr:hypothetical protein [Portunus trituberculatus]
MKPEKFKFCRRQVEFVGFHVGWDAYKPTEYSGTMRALGSEGSPSARVVNLFPDLAVLQPTRETSNTRVAVRSPNTTSSIGPCVWTRVRARPSPSEGSPSASSGS